jgi:hypothetical protein
MSINQSTLVNMFNSTVDTGTSWNNGGGVAEEGGEHVHEGERSDGSREHCHTWMLHRPLIGSKLTLNAANVN